MDWNPSRFQSRPTRFSKICAPPGRCCQEPNIAGLESRSRQEFLTTGTAYLKNFRFYKRFLQPRSCERSLSGEFGNLKELLQKAVLTSGLTLLATPFGAKHYLLSCAALSTLANPGPLRKGEKKVFFVSSNLRPLSCLGRGSVTQERLARTCSE